MNGRLNRLLSKSSIYFLLLTMLGIGLLCGAGTKNAYAQQGLVAAYGFNEGSGALTSDSSGYGNTGSISGAAWLTSGKFGSTLLFNGTSDRVNISDSSSLDLTTGMTLEAWVYPTSLGSWRTVILKETSNGLAFGLYASNDSSRPAAYINVGGVDRSATGANSLPPNAWSHLAATYNGTTLLLYVNGTQVASASISGSIPVSSNPMRVGGNAVWGEYFSGRIDEVRVYNTSLTSAQIQTDMNRAVAPDTTPPTVGSVSPLSGATGVSTVSQVTVTFSEAMNSSTITTSTFYLKNPSNVTVSGTLSYNSSTNTATLTPSSSLANSTTYMATVTSGVTDVAGNGLASNYTWSFTTAVSDTTRPTISSVSPSAGATGVSTVSQVTVTFSEAMNSSTITAGTVYLRTSSNATVSASVSYSSATNTAILTPTNSLGNSSSYTATVTTDVRDVAGNAMATAYSWSFTTVSSGALGDGPGGPILVITSGSNPFTRYYGEILLAEGFNEFSIQDISAVSSTILANYDLAILGEISLTSTQATMLTNWVNAGGNLIAMRPDKQLAGLLGLSDAGTSLSEGYILVNTSSGPGAGIVGETIQFHGTADRYTLSGASSLATLYSNATTPTSNPAVTMQSVGSSGGQAAAFVFDLAKSVIYTRQGNPEWSGQERDGISPIRSDDLFYPDWVNLDKVAIPQADEQQRLLANMIIQMNYDRKPLPRFWYFPRELEAVVIMTGDDHGYVSGGTAGRFDQYIAASPSGCSVENWECIRSTSYVSQESSLTRAQAIGYNAAGFEIGLHYTTNCTDYTPASLETVFSSQIGWWSARFSGLPAPTTNRTHCIVWSDYSTQPQVELRHGIGLDANYYYWPPAWVYNRPGFFTGSGVPMRFTTSAGDLIDVYQVATQMTDESNQSYPFTIDTLLDRAIGVEGYYGAFCANIHTDNSVMPQSEAIIGSAKSRGIPVISAAQMLEWLDGRNASSFGSLSWNGNVLGFTVATGQGATGLNIMIPISAGRSVTRITHNGTSVGYTQRNIKGMDYAVISAAYGTYQVTFSVDAALPTVTSVFPLAGATGVNIGVSVSATFSEAMDASTMSATTFTLRDPSGTFVPATVTYDSGANTATLDPTASLSPSTTYTARVLGGSAGVKDVAGNAMANDFSWSFTTASGSTVRYSIWDTTTVPSKPAVTDGQALELGVKFRSNIDGYIVGLRFYKGAQNTGTNVGNLWTSNGTLLASATFTNETSSGWQEVLFSSPIAIVANTTYIGSYHSSSGYFALNDAYFSSGVSNGPLRALANSEDGGNGVYRYGASGFPTQAWNSNNYWVDVFFATAAEPDTTKPTVTLISPSSGQSGVNPGVSVSATFSETMDASTMSATTFTLRDPSGTLVPATVTYSGATKVATLDPSGSLTPGITYTALILGGATGVKDVAGNAMANDVSWSFSTASGSSVRYSIWATTTIPSKAAVTDGQALELGVKFHSNIDGYIVGLRFYKGTQNTGTHVGNLWTSSGTLLASATFTNETSSGWQEVSFFSPVAIVANTMYIASYHSASGYFALNDAYFTSGVDSGPLRALANGEDGGNGMYRYGASAFPSQTWNSNNYWVDVVFEVR
jgi:hypothetical protein